MSNLGKSNGGSNSEPSLVQCRSIQPGLGQVLFKIELYGHRNIDVVSLTDS